MNRRGALQPGPWLKTPGWRFGSFLLGIGLMALLTDWITGDAVDLGSRVYLVMLLGFLVSIPYGLSWMRGQAPEPPKPATLVPQAAIQPDGSGNTYVLVNPGGGGGKGLVRRPSELGPISWFLYTIFWRVPLMVGDAILTAAWRGITRVFGFNGGPRLRDVASAELDQMARPESRPQPDRDTF